MTDGAEEDIQERDDPVEAVKRAFASGRIYAEAELDRQKLRVGLAAAAGRDAAILGVIALVLALATITALLVGLIVILALHMGPWVALASVIGGALLVLVLLILAMHARVKHMIKAMRL